MTFPPHCDCHLLSECKFGGPQQQARDVMVGARHTTRGWTGRWRGQENGRPEWDVIYSGIVVLRLGKRDRLKDERDKK